MKLIFLTIVLILSLPLFATEDIAEEQLTKFCSRPDAKIPSTDPNSLYAVCQKIMKNIEQNRTKNIFSCECFWNGEMTPSANYEDGKKCTYDCDCKCENVDRKSKHRVTAISKENEDSKSYICHDQTYLGDPSRPWTLKPVGSNIIVKPTTPSHRYPDLTNQLDKLLKCN